MLTQIDGGDDNEAELTGCGYSSHLAPLDSHLRGRLELPDVARTVDVKVLVDSGSEVTGKTEYQPPTTEVVAGGGAHAAVYRQHGGGGRR